MCKPASHPGWRAFLSEVHSLPMASWVWISSRIVLLSGWLVARQLVAQSSDDVERYAEQGKRALAQEHYAEAEKAFEKLRELQPAVAEVHANLGLIIFRSANSNRRCRRSARR